MSASLAMSDSLDLKLNAHFGGAVVRKDLLHAIKKGTNVPSFVLEFLLARFCATDDPEEIQSGLSAVVETIQKNYVRPDESNRAQSLVQQRGRHRFIDKVHVRYVEHEKRHWAELENFGSRRIAVEERFYRDNDRLLEGGIWAEVTVAHNDIEDDPYAFSIEELRPIQMSRFDWEAFCRGRHAFSRDEWLDVLLRSIGLEADRLTTRQKMHFLARLFPFVEANYNFIELGPRGTGKSYVFSEFSPYAILISGGQASTPTLFYNNARKKVGLVGFWDVVTFDEVGGIRIKDANTIDILKDYMANGRFSRGANVIANASLGFVGNIDHSIEQLVASSQLDLFQPLPPNFDLAVMDRFHFYLPGWEMPKNGSSSLTERFGFITDYLAEVFHYLAKKENRYDWVNSHCHLGRALQGRDEVAVNKTVCALLKLLHPASEPTPDELEQYLAYALEGRRRVKEQMNKRKPDDEFAGIGLSFWNARGEEVEVWCPESKGIEATQNPQRKRLSQSDKRDAPSSSAPAQTVVFPAASHVAEEAPPLLEQHFRINHGDYGHSYETLFGRYLQGAQKVRLEDPYLRTAHQCGNLVRFCELLVRTGGIAQLEVVSHLPEEEGLAEVEDRFSLLSSSLLEWGIVMEWEWSETLHNRKIEMDNGWTIKMDRGLDIYLKPDNWCSIGSQDLELRRCREVEVDIFHQDNTPPA